MVVLIVYEVMKLNGGWPTRCQSSVSMCPDGGRGFSNDVKAGNVLNRIFLEPALPVIRSNDFIIEESRTVNKEPELFTFIKRYYNQTRLHSYNRYKTPNETEAALRNGALAA